MLKRVFLFSLLSLAILSCKPEEQESTLIGSVASAHPLATQAGLEILENGGNAFDAAIAVASTLNVVEPMMSGMGGYGTILVYDVETDAVRFLNASGRFPVNTNTDLMRAPTPDFMVNRTGPKSISTPGNLNAWTAMHKSYGSVEWNELFTSAIDRAENGFTIGGATASQIQRAFDDFSTYSQGFYGKDGRALQEGEQLVQVDLANTFKRIAKEGAKPFYHGDIATAIDKEMQRVGSFLSLEDLKQNQAEWWEPYKFKYRGYDVYTASLPANSFPAFVNLGMMQEVEEQGLAHNSTKYLHLFAEMTKESYKSRLAYSFDPEVREAPIDSILSKPVLNAMTAAIDRDKASEFVLPFAPESKNTTHFTIIDKWGNIVSATQTLGNLFGSRVMVEGTGVWLNNSMAYATYEPKGNPMDAFPGRHKLSGDCPIIIMKGGAPFAALGTPGGHTITQNVPQIIFNLIDFNMGMQEAIDAPKLVFAEPDRIIVDPGLPEEIVNALKAKGHNVMTRTIGNATGIKILRDGQGETSGFDTGIDNRGKGRSAVIDR
ncbi:gamma-glutamyltransferase [Roseivirga sp. E12]|uniref:gamma-glutamyltransferase n=1 Tax=Roseivirga sp. E12 TaxID=2819237 RepID=UPI001ABC71D6|nr:gamma-glutamyltransferase [Roseivirga sp. E12]MBO3698168.1 gamma-glutamyltransferase [Roseivirga sp. E12]